MNSQTFLKLDYQLLKDPNLTLEEKIIISYLKSFQDNNKYCYQSQTEIALLLGLTSISLKRSIKNLKEKKIIFTSNDRKYLIPFNNRKAIILVDKNNPIPSITEGDINCHNQNRQEIKIDNPQQEEDSVLKQEDAAQQEKYSFELINGKTVYFDKQINDIDNLIINVLNKPKLLKRLRLTSNQTTFNEIILDEIENNLVLSL